MRTAFAVAMTAALVPAVSVATATPAAAANRTQILGGDRWALDRLDQVVRQPDDGQFRYHDSVSGSGVTIFVLGTGKFYDEDSDVDGRVGPALGFGGSRNASPALDPECQGGSYPETLASLAAGGTYGVAKDARIRFLQIDTCETREVESCSEEEIDHDDNPSTPDRKIRTCDTIEVADSSIADADLIEAIDWVGNSAPRPAVGLFAFVDAGQSVAVEQALSRSAARGVTWVLPAGDDTQQSACDHTPSRLGGAVDGVITVGAVDRDDRYAPSTGWGSCVDIFAPGVDVEVPNGAHPILADGTAYAAGFTAGVIAQYLEPGADWTPARLEQHLKSQATVGALRNLPAGSPNLLLHSAWWGPVLHLLCENTGMTSTSGRFACEVTDLNGASTGLQWYKDGQHRPVWDGLTEVAGPCTVGNSHTFQVEATRFGHRAVARFGGFRCQLAP